MLRVHLLSSKLCLSTSQAQPEIVDVLCKALWCSMRCTRWERKICQRPRILRGSCHPYTCQMWGYVAITKFLIWIFRKVDCLLERITLKFGQTWSDHLSAHITRAIGSPLACRSDFELRHTIWIHNDCDHESLLLVAVSNSSSLAMAQPDRILEGSQHVPSISYAFLHDAKLKTRLQRWSLPVRRKMFSFAGVPSEQLARFDCDNPTARFPQDMSIVLFCTPPAISSDHYEQIIQL